MKLNTMLVLCVCTMISIVAQAQFHVVENGKPCEICISPVPDAGVKRAVEALAGDVQAMCGTRPQIVTQLSNDVPQIVVGIYTEDLLKPLAKASALRDSTEKHIIDVTAKRIVIAGADKRGAIYGVYHLAEMIGVSPWAWWADVDIIRSQDVAVNEGSYTEGVPSVKYRGIFLNDEWPSLGSWANEKMGGFNSKFYERVFELLLRLRANFIWPAMWGSAFFDDDPLNGPLANEMGIIVGTSHHEPMNLAQQDWKRRGSGEWNYQTNKKSLTDFWTSGIERAKNFETVTTVGMRGDGDMPMTGQANADLLQKIINDQRKIIKSVTGKNPADVPQVWALYKEVQDYYDKGMRVPDDITILLSDDNWGNLRRLPSAKERNRKGGFGMYYHFDYVGGPRNYKWLNVTQIERVWEQMELAYQNGVNRIWIANVGDLKPMEYPIDFFLRMAWRPESFTPDNLHTYTVNFCRQQFGEEAAETAASLLERYTKYNSRRTPEMLSDSVYSANYGEWDRVLNEYRTLELEAQRIMYTLPEERRVAFDELVLFPISAVCNLYEMYYAVMRNGWSLSYNRGNANDWADKVEKYYDRDSQLTQHYHELRGGKWNHMMDQTHIGYYYWQQPDQQSMPNVGCVMDDDEDLGSKYFVEDNGYISIDMENYSVKRGNWSVVPNLGRTSSAMIYSDLSDTTYLEYAIESEIVGLVRAHVYCSPNLDPKSTGVRFAVCIDGGEETIVDLLEGGMNDMKLYKWQGERIVVSNINLKLVLMGRHNVRIRPLTEGIVFQHVDFDFGGLLPTYLGAPPTKILYSEQKK